MTTPKLADFTTDWRFKHRRGPDICQNTNKERERETETETDGDRGRENGKVLSMSSAKEKGSLDKVWRDFLNIHQNQCTTGPDQEKIAHTVLVSSPLGACQECLCGHGSKGNIFKLVLK